MKILIQFKSGRLKELNGFPVFEHNIIFRVWDKTNKKLHSMPLENIEEISYPVDETGNITEK